MLSACGSVKVLDANVKLTACPSFQVWVPVCAVRVGAEAPASAPRMFPTRTVRWCRSRSR